MDLAFKKVNYILKLSMEILLQIQQSQNLKFQERQTPSFIFYLSKVSKIDTNQTLKRVANLSPDVLRDMRE